MQPALFVPGCEFRGPVHHVGPHQIAELADLQLGIELGPQIHEVQECPQAEAHHKMLAVVEGKDAAGVLFGEAGPEQIPVALSCASAEIKIL